MNKKFLIVGVAIAFMTTMFFGCTKTNIKNGNKKIVGTWVLSSETSSSNTVNEYTVTYATNDCDYENYNSKDVYDYTYSFNGTTRTRTAKISETYEGVTESTETTTTSTYVRELTFNEDGTFTSYTKNNETDEDGDTYESEYTETGYWSWVDGAETKMAIKIEGEGETTIFVESMTKDEMVSTVTTSYTNTYTNVYQEGAYCFTSDSYITQTNSGTETYTYNGSMTFTKKEEE